MPTALNEETGELQILDKAGQWKPARIATHEKSGQLLYYDVDDETWLPAPKGAKDPTGGRKPAQGPAMSTLMQGATLGFADEVAAAGRAAGRFLKSLTEGKSAGDAATDAKTAYGEQLFAERKGVKQFREENPVSAAALEIGGGFVGAVPSAAARAPGYVRNIVDSATAGGIAGFGAGEGGLEERAISAGIGATIAGTFLAVIPVGVNAFAKVRRYIGDVIGLTDGENVAMRKVVQAFQRDGITPEDAINRLTAWEAQGAKPEMLADLGGENVKALARAAAQLPGAGRNKAVAALAERQAGQGDRLSDDIARAISNNRQFYETMDDLAAARSTDAAPLYQRAFSAGPVTNDRIEKFVKDPIIQRGIKQGLEIERLEALAQNRTFNPTDYAIIGFNEAGDPIMGKVPNMRLLDAAKKGLDQILEGYRSDVTGKLVLDQKGKAIDNVRRTFIAALDELNPDYAAARAAWAGPSQSRDAMALGRDIFRKDSEVTAKAIADLSDSDRQFFKAGVVRAIKDLADKAQDGADLTKRIFGSKAMRDKLRLAFDSPEEYRAFADAIKREADMFNVARDVSPKVGSQTTPRQLEGEDLADDPALTALGRLLVGDVGGAARQSAQAVGARARGIRPDVAEGVVDRLFAPADQTALQRLRDFQAARDAALQDRARRMGQLTTAAGAGLGGQGN